MAGSPDRTGDPTPLELGQAAAAQLGGEWQLDAESPGAADVSPPEEPAPSSEPSPTRGADAPRPPRTFPRLATPEPEPGTTPPRPEQIVEAMLFVGGHPLTPQVACAAVRGLTADAFRAAVDLLNRRYRSQNRPYA